MNAFGNYLRQERQRLGLSLDGAAARTGLSKSRLRELETGLSLKTRRPTSPTARNIAAIARGLGIDQNHLAGLAGLGYRADPNSEQESELLVLFRDLGADQRPLALRLLMALRDSKASASNRVAERSGNWKD